MRRGGPIFLVLGVILVLIIGALAFFVLSPNLLASLLGTPPTDATPTVTAVKVVVAGQSIGKDQEITSDMLTTIDLPQTSVRPNMLTDPQELIGKFAVLDIPQGWFVSADMFAGRPETGSSKVILPGQVAISIPAKRIDMVGYAIKDGDYVDVIATTLFTDLDANFQSELPNSLGQVVNSGSVPESAPLAVLGMNNGTGGSKQAGRAELDPTLNQVVYFIPSEAQRPRLVSQMILQDIQVLHVGQFSLVPTENQPTPDPAAEGQGAPTEVPVIVEPNMITLIVSPQDAVSLTYLQYSGVKLTFVLRAPDDRSRAETEAATLQYILSQYNISIPAKLPYGMEASGLPSLEEPTPTPRP
jgi:pilus assembly protein CpaB